MSHKIFCKGIRYKQPTPGVGLEPEVVDWQLERRQLRKRRLLEDAAFEGRMAEEAEFEPKGIWRAIAVIVTLFKRRS